MLAIGEALTKGHTITPQVWKCDMCQWHHIGAVKEVTPRCWYNGKFSFMSEQEALEQLAVFMRRAAEGDIRREERSAYTCPKCKKWHLTSAS